MTNFIIKDSGEREDMESGSRRDTSKGKTRPDLVNPLVAERVGMHYANGCEKYGMRNFELGQKSSRYLESLERHVLDLKRGCKIEDHAAAIVWNSQQLILNEEMVKRGIYPPEICDLTDYTDLESFDRTVGDPARAFNQKLREEEASRVVDGLDQKLLSMTPDCEGEPEEDPEAHWGTGRMIAFRGPEVQAEKNRIARGYLTDMFAAIYGDDPVSHGMEECDTVQDPITLDEVEDDDDDCPNCAYCDHKDVSLGELPCNCCSAIDENNKDCFFQDRGCESCDHESVQYDEWPCTECSRNAQYEDNEHDFFFDSGFNETE